LHKRSVWTASIAVAWFNYARGRRQAWEAARAEVPALQERMSNPFLGQPRTTLPDNTRKSSWDGRQEKQETTSAQQEQQSQDASNNAEGDVGATTAQGLSNQASTTLARTQNRGVLGDVAVATEDSGAGEQTRQEKQIDPEVAEKIQEVIDSADDSKELPRKKATIGGDPQE